MGSAQAQVWQRLSIEGWVERRMSLFLEGTLCSQADTLIPCVAQRVQNLRLWKAYYAKRADLAEDLGGAPVPACC